MMSEVRFTCVLLALIASATNSPLTLAMARGVSAATEALVADAQADLQTRWEPLVTFSSQAHSSARTMHAGASSADARGEMPRPPLAVAARNDEAGAVDPRLVDDPKPQATTVMKCLGTTIVTRACHFEDVYYELAGKRFVYFGPPGATPELFGQSHEPGDPWLRLIRGVKLWKREEKATQFFMDWRSGEPLPLEHEVAVFTQPLHLRSTMNTRSFGHLIRDNLLGLIDLPLRFGRDPLAFDWVRWHSNLERSMWQQEHRTAQHYRGLLNNRPSLTWQQVLDTALEDSDTSSVKFIRFSEIIAGQGPADLVTQVGKMAVEADSMQLAQWALMCGPYPFSAMREVAYRNHGLQVASVEELEPFVLFLNGQRHETKHLLNVDELIPSLRETFPGVRMQHVKISTRPLEAQLELLSKATVVVSNIGSRSFRLIYLPNGATTILVGPPEYTFDVPPQTRGDAPTRDRVPAAFREIDACWAYIGYVHMLQYHVTAEAEVRRTQPWHSWAQARDADIILDETKLTPLLRLALERGRNGRAFAGSGTLSAYEDFRP